MGISQQEMILDMDVFDFADIDDNDIQEVIYPNQDVLDRQKARQPKIDRSIAGDANKTSEENAYKIAMDPNDSFEYDEMIDVDDDDYYEELLKQHDDGVVVENATEFQEALGKLETIPDDFELNFGGDAKLKKKDFVELLKSREEVMTTREALGQFTNTLVEKENLIHTTFAVAKTETEKQLEQVYSMLNDPNKWNSGTDVAQLQRARIQLEARKQELDTEREKAQGALNEQKQQSMVFNLQRVIQQMGSDAPLKSAAKYAEEKGMNLDGIVSGLTPSLVEALNNAAKFEALMNKNKGRLEKAALENRSRSRAAKAKIPPKAAADQKARAYQAYKSGKMSHSDFFDFLDD